MSKQGKFQTLLVDRDDWFLYNSSDGFIWFNKDDLKWIHDGESNEQIKGRGREKTKS